MLKRFEIKIFFSVLLLLAGVTAVALLIARNIYPPLFLLVPVVLYLTWRLMRYQQKIYTELENFVLSIRYKDFSRRFDVKHAPRELKKLRAGFNEISDVFRTMSKEKEMHYQYLQKIIEMVDTGILSYDLETKEVVWMNESLKHLLQLPYLKSLEGLKRRDKILYEDILTLKPGESKVTNAHIDKDSYKILTAATAFQTEEKKYKLITFQNISEAVDETESQAWKKLLSVMTHEIMNSVAPISSLAGTLKNRLEDNHSDEKSGLFEDVVIGIDTIKKRSESLLKFAETYRNLNKISQPDTKLFYVHHLFENIFNLMEPTLLQKGIEMEVVLKEMDMQLEADITLVEQVLINLVVNAIEAVKEKEDKRIVLSADRNSHKRVMIRVADNGSGMEPEILEKIFIPFFSTKKNGSGIGLSLCRQIMRLHKGGLQVKSEPGDGTVFTMQF